MAKKSEINKKGRLAKSTLSVVLAASMVLTSSSFVWAAPAEPVAVIEEGDAAVDAVEVPDEVGTGVEENVRAIADVTVTVDSATYTGAPITPKVTVVDKTGGTLIENKDYTLGGWTNNTAAGVNTAEVTVTFIGEYVGTPEKVQSFTIDPFVLNSSNIGVQYPEAGYIYTGAEVKPDYSKVVITPYSGVPSTFDKDVDLEMVAYSDSYNLTDVGNQKVKLVAKSDNYTISGDLGVYDYTVEQAAFSESILSVTSNPVNYTSSPVAADVEVSVTAGGAIVDPSQYTIKYYDDKDNAASGPQTNAGTYKITVVSNGTGNFKAGSIDKTYTIRVATLAQAVEGMKIAGTTQDKNDKSKYFFTYNGKGQTISASDVSIPGLIQGLDYTVNLENATEITEVNDTPVNVVIEGINKYENDPDATVKLGVKAKLLNKTDYAITAQMSKGSSAPFVVIKDGEKELVKDTDFTLDNVNTAKKTVEVTGAGNYTTVVNGVDTPLVVSYTVADKILMNDPAITATLKNAPYSWTGKQVTPPVADLEVKKDNTTPLEADKDFTVSYGTNVESGAEAGVVILTGKGDYSGTREVKFEIKGINIADNYMIQPMSSVSEESAKAGNGKQAPKVTFKNGASAPALTYTVKYLKNNSKDITDDAEAFKALKDGDTVNVEVTGSGKYSGTITESYTIAAGKLIAENAKVDAIADQAYTGKAIEPTVVVRDANNATKLLTLNKDYTVAYTNNTDAGTAFVTITGMGEYTGNLVTSFKIVGQMDQEIVVLPAQVRDLGNGSRTLKSKATVVKYTIAPKTEATYASSDTDVVEVDAKTGAIKYTGVGTATITITAPESDIYKAATKELTVKVVPVTPANVKVTSSAKRKITVKADEVKEAAKYQIRIQKDGHSSVYVNVDNKGDLNKVYTTKSSGKFNVWVRAYKTVGAKDHHFSAWSAKKTVTVK